MTAAAGLLLAALWVPAALPAAEPFGDALRERLEAAARAEPGRDRRTAHTRDDGSPRYTNRLVLEASPYLRQHAHNPVNWYPWGDEAFAAARRLGRPVLVSIGYSTCHWCHVMEEESFDDPEVAAYLNAHFVAVKVDRESRPDVDSVYMTALNALSGRGGWPANLFVTPDRRPFFGGTYFPKDRFLGVLRAIHGRWERDPASLQKAGRELTALVQRSLDPARPRASWAPGPAPLVRARERYAAGFDAEWGGLRSAQKFPGSLNVRFLLRHHRRTRDPDSLAMATFTLDRMAAGGIRDHLGGGFHRYTVDREWRIPHFEKMLYDNALLAVDYLEAWQATGRAHYADVAREILDYLAREMQAATGGFHSATDADSRAPSGEMQEGRFFTWTPAEVGAVLGAEAASDFTAYYGVTEAGNLEGRSVLAVPRPAPGRAASLAEARQALYRARAERPAPLRDEKILAAWNGLAISAFARAGFAFDRPGYVGVAADAASFVLEAMREDGRLRRVFQGGRSSGPAFLDDHAFLIAGLLDLYQADGDARWLREAIALQKALDDRYADAEGGGYYRTADDHPALLVREKPVRDGALPSGNAVAALNLLRLHAFTTDPAYRARADLLLAAQRELLESDPTAVAELLVALDFRLEPTKEIVVASGEGLGALLAPLREELVPNAVLAVVEPETLPELEALVPVARGKRPRDGRATAYVCRDRVCRLPTADPQVFRSQIEAATPLEQ